MHACICHVPELLPASKLHAHLYLRFISPSLLNPQWRFAHGVACCVCADKIGPTMAVLRLDVQRNIEVSKQDLLLLSLTLVYLKD